MLDEADCPIDPESDIVRCRRLRPDGTALELGLLHFDHDRREYRVQPDGAEVDSAWYPTMGMAMDALYEHVVERLAWQQVRLSNDLWKIREDLALLGGRR